MQNQEAVGHGRSSALYRRCLTSSAELKPTDAFCSSLGAVGALPKIMHFFFFFFSSFSFLFFFSFDTSLNDWQNGEEGTIGLCGAG